MVNAHELYTDGYYKHVYFKKSLCDGVELASKMERTSTKQAAGILMKAGLSKYMEVKVEDLLLSNIMTKCASVKKSSNVYVWAFIANYTNKIRNLFTEIEPIKFL
jgi:hypothetical protein